MQFKKYQHLEKLGTSETNGIEYGLCHVFPKIDGTNASIWLSDEGVISAGSRTRQLTVEQDNAGFYNWVLTQANLLAYFQENPTHTLYGEWLVPHSLKTYKETAWRQFYVFDVMDNEDYLHYDSYKSLLEKYDINYIPSIATINNGSYEQFINQLANNVFLIEDGSGTGEGIVIKNYSFTNRYGQKAFAKIVTSEFKEKHAKVMGGNVLNGKKLVEEEIANEFVTTALCEKEYSKIELSDGWSSKMIPKLLNVVYYCIVKEDCWEFVKQHKNPVIDFKRLQHFVFAKVKEKIPHLF